MKRFAWFVTSLIVSCSANAANVCSEAILARISALQARAEKTQNRALFSALQTRIRMAKSAGIDVRRLNVSTARTQAKRETQTETATALEAKRSSGLKDWRHYHWTLENVAQTSYSPNGQLVAVLRYAPHVLEVRMARDGSFVSGVPIPMNEYNGSHVHFITDDVVALTKNTEEGSVTFYDVHDLKPVIFEKDIQRRTILMSGDGKRAILKSDRIWDFVEFPSRKPIGHAKLIAPSGVMTDLTGNRIAYSNVDTVRVYDLALDKTFTFNTNSNCWSIALSPDGKYVVSTGDRLSLWSVDTGQWIRDFDTDGAPVRDVYFTNGGKTIVAFDNPAKSEMSWIRMIDFESGELLDMAQNNFATHQTAIGADGSTIAFHGQNENYHFIELAPEQRP
jgi:WD40 repeat protein